MMDSYLFEETCSFDEFSPFGAFEKPKPKPRHRKKEKSKNLVKRKKCPAKEKERNEAINNGFDLLQSRIKCIQAGEKNSKIPKVKILKMAIRYINYLKEKLDAPDEAFNPSTDDFVLQAMEVIQTKNCYTKRAAEEMEETEIPSDAILSSPPDHDAGYGSPPESTPSSNYSSDYYEIPPSLPTMDSLPLSNPPFYNHFQIPSYSSHFSMDYEMYPTWKSCY